MHAAESVPAGMEHVKDLLSRRMLANALDECEVGRVAPALLHDLQRRCVLCESREECELGLADDFADVGWNSYCPNVTTLDDLCALPWFRLPAAPG